MEERTVKRISEGKRLLIGSAVRWPMDAEILPEGILKKLLLLERKRTERSGRHFVLMILDAGDLLRDPENDVLPSLTAALGLSTRETDVKGWWGKDNSVLAVIFTEVAGDNIKAIVDLISTKVANSLRTKLSPDQFRRIRLTFHVYPEDWESDNPSGPLAATLRLDLGAAEKNMLSLMAKRYLDILGSLSLLTVFLPLMGAIAVLIKFTSKGPVLFRQLRLGQYGRKFTFLKFRTMYVDADHTIHEQYIESFIKGENGAGQGTVGQQKLYKLTNDPRITTIGRFLRKTSLDELPQFVNVLCGQMSLVGPRPPLPYEAKRYDCWHKQRLTAVKPGITGLWQVEGRSRVAFDEMVRLDIRYARSWSIWLDIKILLQTPKAVLSGAGAH